MHVSSRFALGLGLVGLVACRFDTGGTGAAVDAGSDPDVGIPADAAVPDAPSGAPDANPNAPDADPNAPDAKPCGWTYAPAHFDPCDAATPDPDGLLSLTIPGTYVYDTDTGILTAPDDVMTTPTSSDLSGARAIWVGGFLIESSVTLRVEGSQPLLIASFGDIDVFGAIDASSFFNAGENEYSEGAGSNPASCPASPPDPGQACSNHGGSGGGAGALGGDGGDGGRGGAGRNCGGLFPTGMPGGDGGVAVSATPMALRGGCSGRDGATNDTPGSTEFGVGGPGGGGIHLAARDALTVSGTIHAGGAGGGPGTDDRAGGGGAGSGGMVGLEGATVQLTSTSVVAANGGGGGGGCKDDIAARGGDGAPGSTPAAGGLGQDTGGPGAAGGAGSSPDGTQAVAAARGGGGGGGGVGFVILYGPTAPSISAGAVVSPGAIID